jgi:hypothetical protein
MGAKVSGHRILRHDLPIFCLEDIILDHFHNTSYPLAVKTVFANMRTTLFSKQSDPPFRINCASLNGWL